VNISLNPKENLHTREVYNIIDLIGNLGGVFEIIVKVLGLFFLPISSHSFVMKALEKLFLARTLDTSMFVKAKLENKNKKRKFRSLKAKIPEVFKNTPVEAEARNHYPIKLSFLNNIKLFMLNLFSCKSKDKTSFSHRLLTLYNVGRDKIEKSLRIEKLLKQHRDICHLVNSSLLDEALKY
jgi:hypothetical protein